MSTARATEEWIGANPDTDIPPRVKIRLFERAGGRCQCCTRKIISPRDWQADHIVALINGGQNRETNLQCLCSWCHLAKTRNDVAEKAYSARVKAKHIGAKPKSSRPMPGSRASGFKRKMDGTVERRGAR